MRDSSQFEKLVFEAYPETLRLARKLGTSGEVTQTLVRKALDRINKQRVWEVGLLSFDEARFKKLLADLVRESAKKFRAGDQLKYSAYASDLAKRANEKLLGVLPKLEVEDQELLALLYGSGKTYEEARQIIKKKKGEGPVALGTIKSRANRAFETLRKLMLEPESAAQEYVPKHNLSGLKAEWGL